MGIRDELDRRRARAGAARGGTGYRDESWPPSRNIPTSTARSVPSSSQSISSSALDRRLAVRRWQSVCPV